MDPPEEADLPVFVMDYLKKNRSTKDGGAECRFDKQLVVKYSRDEETGSQNPALLTAAPEVQAARQDANAVVHVISIKVAGFPYGFAAGSIRIGYDGKGGEIRERYSRSSEEYRRPQIRKKCHGMLMA